MGSVQSPERNWMCRPVSATENQTNVKRAISQVAPDVIDLSSAVEKTSEDGTFRGKDPEKIRTIVTMVHD